MFLLPELAQLQYRSSINSIMKYKKGSTFPYTEANLRTDNPLVSFQKNALTDATVRTDYGVVEVREAVRPAQAGYKVVA